tara:strand:- start:1862 stop:2113 length:252 start_codon:yes stop_codon:yes gene_type:complete
MEILINIIELILIAVWLLFGYLLWDMNNTYYIPGKYSYLAGDDWLKGANEANKKHRRKFWKMLGYFVIYTAFIFLLSLLLTND